MSTEPRDENVAANSTPESASASAPAASADAAAVAAAAAPVSGTTEPAATAATAATAEPAAAPAADPRPKPAYGEYAPEGWEWTPPAAEPAPPANAGNRAPAAPAAQGVSGVPHNLGARGAAAGAAGSAATRPVADTTAENATKHADANGAQHYRANAPVGAPPAPKRGVADRVFSILFLVIGAFGALNMSQGLISLPETFILFANAAELNDYTPSETLSTAGTVGAIVILAIYAINLILTIQRIRAGKLAFWVPLVAAVLAIITMFVVMFIALGATPELIDFMSDPDAMNRLLEQLTPTP